MISSHMVEAHFFTPLCLSFLIATYLSALLHCVSQRFKYLKKEKEAKRFITHTTSKLVLTEKQPQTSADAFLMAMCL